MYYLYTCILNRCLMCSHLCSFTTLLVALCYSSVMHAQNYSTLPVCGTDTIHVNHRNMHSAKTIHYDAFLCNSVSKWGIRTEIGRSSFQYTPATSRWLGRHAGGSFALHVAYGKVNVGARAVLTTTKLQMPMQVDGQLLPTEARLNPAKIEYSVAYTQHIVANFCVEPFVAITSNKFYVTNEDTLKAHYQIPQVNALTAGVGVHKYFTIAQYQYLCAFVRYAHCFANFGKVNPTLGKGYDEWQMGIAFKMFGARKYHRVINGTQQTSDTL